MSTRHWVFPCKLVQLYENEIILSSTQFSAKNLPKTSLKHFLLFVVNNKLAVCRDYSLTSKRKQNKIQQELACFQESNSKNTTKHNTISTEYHFDLCILGICSFTSFKVLTSLGLT